MARPRAGEPSRGGIGTMLAARCRDCCPATGAGGVTAPATVAAIRVILARSNTVTRAAAVTAAIASSVSSGSRPASTATAATSSSSSTSSSATAALSQRGSYGQSNDSESEHEHTEDCHVAASLDR